MRDGPTGIINTQVRIIRKVVVRKMPVSFEYLQLFLCEILSNMHRVYRRRRNTRVTECVYKIEDKASRTPGK